MQAFFVRWWSEQSEEVKAAVKGLVSTGQLEFINGGYVQHDEAAAHFVAMIDQTTRGHRCAGEATCQDDFRVLQTCHFPDMRYELVQNISDCMEGYSVRF